MANDLNKTCNALGIYYKWMGRNNYFNNKRILFTLWFEKEEYNISDINEELQDDNYEDCSYLEFDNNFLMNNIDNNNNKNEKNEKSFKMIQLNQLNQLNKKKLIIYLVNIKIKW